MLRVLPFTLFALLTACVEPSAATPCDEAQAAAVIAPDNGATPLLVEGQVFRRDGATPAAGVIVYAFHTGANGSYESNASGRPRRDAFMRTDAEGRFELRTTMPGAYPDEREAAHVHLQLWGAGTPEQWAEDILFADDPLLAPSIRSRSASAERFAWVSDAPMENGVRVVRRAIRLKPQGDRFEPVTRHGLDLCAAD